MLSVVSLQRLVPSIIALGQGVLLKPRKSLSNAVRQNEIPGFSF
jgi:hypothetical protein